MPGEWILHVLVQFHLGTYQPYEGPWRGPHLNIAILEPQSTLIENRPAVSTGIDQDLQLSVNSACLEFGPNDSKVILKQRLGYVPKVLSTPFRAQVIVLSVLPTESLLCPVRALKVYIEHSDSYRKSEQLFVGFGNHAKDGPVTKQRISRWLVDAITLAYSSLGLQCPIGVRAHSNRGIASSWAWSSGVSISDICEATGWSLPSTFVRFYNLDVPALQARVLSA